MAACKQCELSRIKGVVVKKCGARNTDTVVEVSQEPAPIGYDLTETQINTATELFSDETDIDNEEAE